MIGMSPDELGNATSPILGWHWSPCRRVSTRGGVMRRSWYRPVVQVVVADRSPTIAGPAPRQDAILSRSPLPVRNYTGALVLRPQLHWDCPSNRGRSLLPRRRRSSLHPPQRHTAHCNLGAYHLVALRFRHQRAQERAERESEGRRMRRSAQRRAA
jgi:hypothetical protein